MMLKVQRKQRLFIYDRREVGVLLILAVMVAFFAFTLGVHLGKRVSPQGAVSGPEHVAGVPTVDEEMPNPQELTDHAKAARQAADESLDQAAHDEVERAGLKLDKPKQVELPTATKGKTGGATSAAREESAATTHSEPASEPSPDASAQPQRETVTIDSIPAASRPAPQGKFTLQVGSHRFLDEARDQAIAVEAAGLKPYLRAADIKGKGTWYRLYVGGFPTRDAAEKAGQQYRSQSVIESFIVAPGVR